jgi:hypothetical protein
MQDCSEKGFPWCSVLALVSSVFLLLYRGIADTFPKMSAPTMSRGCKYAMDFPRHCARQGGPKNGPSPANSHSAHSQTPFNPPHTKFCSEIVVSIPWTHNAVEVRPLNRACGTWNNSEGKVCARPAAGSLPKPLQVCYSGKCAVATPVAKEISTIWKHGCLSKAAGGTPLNEVFGFI